MQQKVYVQNAMGQLVEVSPDQIGSPGIGGGQLFGGLGGWDNNLIQAQLRGNVKTKQVI